MWELPKLSDGSTYSFADIVEHGRRTGLYITAPGSVQDYVRQRKGRLRLSDGRILKFGCKALPDGGRLMTFDDISGFVRAAEQLRELADIDELTKLPNRRQFLRSLETEFVRVQRYDRPLSVLMIDADDFKLINDRQATLRETTCCGLWQFDSAALSGRSIYSVGWAAKNSRSLLWRPTCRLLLRQRSDCAAR